MWGNQNDIRFMCELRTGGRTMSYEGYDRFLCSNGHLWQLDTHETMYDDKKQKCPKCGKEEVWSEMIDETNDEVWSEMIDETNDEGNPTKLTLDNEQTKMCEHCETILDAIYLIPGSAEVFCKYCGVKITKDNFGLLSKDITCCNSILCITESVAEEDDDVNVGVSEQNE